jgi:protein subunit release factor B
MTPGRVPPEVLRQTYRLPDGDEDLLSECDVTAFRASGPGGQHRNKTFSAVRLRHRPSGVVVIGRRERSQRRNLADALARLRQKLARLLEEPRARKPTRVPAEARKRRLEEKRRRAKLKRNRSPPDWD